MHRDRYEVWLGRGAGSSSTRGVDEEVEERGTAAGLVSQQKAAPGQGG